jgi:hypothetical protein
MDALSRGMGGNGVAERLGGVWGDLPHGLKNKKNQFGHYYLEVAQNSQDYAISAYFFADFELSLPDLTAML